MKILFLLTFLSAFNSWSSDAPGRIDGNYNGPIQTVIENRCERYFSRNLIQNCRLNVRKMVKNLNIDLIILDNQTQTTWKPESFVFAAFQQDLIEVLSDPGTTKYLVKLKNTLESYLSGNIPKTTLIESSAPFFRTSFLSARAIAVLFQDTSIAKLHLRYLEHAHLDLQKTVFQNKDLLSEVIDVINLLYDFSPENYRNFFYPPSVAKILDKNIYHFYVPYYLVQLLTYRDMPMAQIHQASILMTLTYEFITTSRDFRFIFKDPETINSEQKVRDIYAGYSGSLLGLNYTGKQLTYDEMLANFKVSTRTSVLKILKIK